MWIFMRVLISTKMSWFQHWIQNQLYVFLNSCQTEKKATLIAKQGNTVVCYDANSYELLGINWWNKIAQISSKWF